MKMPRLETGPLELIRWLAAEPPGWHLRNIFLSTHGASTLRAAERRGWIELETHRDPELWRFRLTAAGRAILEPTHAE